MYVLNIELTGAAVSGQRFKKSHEFKDRIFKCPLAGCGGPKLPICTFHARFLNVGIYNIFMSLESLEKESSSSSYPNSSYYVRLESQHPLFLKASDFNIIS